MLLIIPSWDTFYAKLASTPNFTRTSPPPSFQHHRPLWPRSPPAAPAAVAGILRRQGSPAGQSPAARQSQHCPPCPAGTQSAASSPPGHWPAWGCSFWPGVVWRFSKVSWRMGSVRRGWRRAVRRGRRSGRACDGVRGRWCSNGRICPGGFLICHRRFGSFGVSEIEEIWKLVV